MIRLLFLLLELILSFGAAVVGFMGLMLRLGELVWDVPTSYALLVLWFLICFGLQWAYLSRSMGAHRAFRFKLAELLYTIGTFGTIFLADLGKELVGLYTSLIWPEQVLIWLFVALIPVGSVHSALLLLERRSIRLAREKEAKRKTSTDDAFTQAVADGALQSGTGDTRSAHLKSVETALLSSYLFLSLHGRGSKGGGSENTQTGSAPQAS